MCVAEKELKWSCYGLYAVVPKVQIHTHKNVNTSSMVTAKRKPLQSGVIRCRCTLRTDLFIEHEY